MIVEHAVFQRHAWTYFLESYIERLYVSEKPLAIGIMVTRVAHCYSVTCRIQSA